MWNTKRQLVDINKNIRYEIHFFIFLFLNLYSMMFSEI